MQTFTRMFARRWAGLAFIFITVLTLMSSCIGVTLTNDDGQSVSNSPTGGPVQLSACVGSAVSLSAGCSTFPGSTTIMDGQPYFVGSGETFTAQPDGSYIASIPVTTTGPQTYTLDCSFPASFTEPVGNLPYSFTILGVDCPGRCVTGSASNLQVSGTLGVGNCSVSITGTGTGKAFVFRGPGGYVFSNAYRSCSPHSIFANGITKPGTYTLDVYGDGIFPLATYSVEVTGSACP